MPKFIDQVGKRFGRLVVKSHEGRNANLKQLWQCQCDCGNTKLVTTQELNAGDTTSCGCLFKERVTKHGGWKKGSYNTWRAMLRRCHNPQDKDYKRYGAVGITVCPEWHDYVTFAADMGEPKGSETLDRINPYGNYIPKNCRWASLSIQARNTRLQKTNKSGFTGVRLAYGKKWIAEITVNNKKFYSQVFNTKEEAAIARKALEQKYWGTT
jgi:hypothetical protein